MKKRILSLALAVTMLFGSAAALPEGAFDDSAGIVASAEEETKKVGDYEYKILDDGTAEIAKYNGKATKLTIPSAMDGKKVTSIGDDAFKECTSLKSITIPNSVKSIGYGAFLYCEKLESITIPKSVVHIGANAFDGTPWFNEQKGGYFSSRKCVVVNGILINADVMKSKESITIPSNVTCIGSWCFWDFDSLKSVVIPDNVKVIDEFAFYSCSNLESVKIGKGVETIDLAAFRNCSSLQNITIPNNVKKIGFEAFRDCTALKSLIIPSSVTDFDLEVFSGCTNLISVTFSDGVKSIAPYSFIGCTKLTNIKIPNSVTSIGDSAFYGTKWLENQQKKNPLVIVNGILIDGTTCKGKVTIPSSITSINNHTFQKCTSLTSITIPRSVKSIGVEAFSGCKNLSSVTISRSVTSIGWRAFSETKWLENQKKKNPLVIVNGILIDGTMCKGKVTIPKGVTSITVGAFDNSSLTSVTIPKSVTSIDDTAFWGCTSLKSVTIPSSVTSIGDYAFGYYYDQGYKLVDGFSIKCYKDTAGEQYAKENGIKYTLLRNPEPKADRLAGDNRYATAAKLSSTMYKTSDTVVLATGLTFNDALVAVPLAAAYNAPLLLGTERHITAQTEAELKRLKAKNVIVVSTNGAIGTKAKAELKALKLNVTYIEGKTCFETASKVAKALQKKAGKAPDTIFFATDSAFADALSASPVAAIKNAPIIYLKNTGSIDSATAAYLKSVKGKVKNAYIIGGDGVISNSMMKNVATALGLTVNKTVVRVAGKNRYETCVAVNNKFKSILSSDGICVAKGLDFPDALAGGVYAAKNRQALFLADGKKLQDVQNTYLKSKNASKITVFGGTGAVPDDLVKLIAQASV